MPILALPAHTASALSSAQVLTDSASLVKELIDNAIDARATIISVEVSGNLLDDIRVRDNGIGVSPPDRPLLCARHCTSKINDLEDLRTIGGSSLGFRGEALASAAEMSGSLTITTRTEGDLVATEMTFNRQGVISNEKRVSLPVGTSVQVVNFLEYLPVRKQTAQKAGAIAKALAKVKHCLQAYALAQPHLRLSFKVLKAKNEKENWKYPKNTQTPNFFAKHSFYDAATDLLGRRVTDQCQSCCATWTSHGKKIDLSADAHRAPEKHGPIYTFEALVAKVGSDTSAISNFGQYISVDSRPMSVKGSFKKIASLYKSALRSKLIGVDSSKVVDPLLCMNIVCPEGSYDANVEPAKDDVLFSDSDLVLQLVEKFLDVIYGRQTPDYQVPKSQFTSQPQGIELLLAKKKTSADVDPNRSSNPEVTQYSSEDSEGNESNFQNVGISNPWVMAKLNGSVRPSKTRTNGNNQLPTPGRQIGDAGSQDPPSSDDPAPFPFPQTARRSRLALETPTRPQQASNRDKYGHGALDTWIQRSICGSSEYSDQDRLVEGEIEPEDPMVPLCFVSAGSLPQETPLSAIPDASQQPRKRPAPHKIEQSGTIHKPFISPVHDPGRVWFEFGDKTHQRHPQHTRQRKEPHSNAEHNALNLRSDEEIPEGPSHRLVFPAQEVHPDLAITLDYEARKQRAELERRNSLRAKPAITTETSNTVNSPHKNRQNAARTALLVAQGDTSTEQTTVLNSNDPRANLLKRQQREQIHLKNEPEAPRLKSRKTSMLPFETMDQQNHVRDLILPIKSSITTFENLITAAGEHDSYINTGDEAEAFKTSTSSSTPPSPPSIRSWNTQLRKLLRTLYHVDDTSIRGEMGAELELDLVTALGVHADEVARLESEEMAAMGASLTQMQMQK